jgi:N4-gp56 family major capsid protein
VLKLFGILFALLGFGLDVITVAAGTAGVAGNVGASLITYLAAKLLEVAEFNTILDQFGEKAALPAGSSKTIRFVREEKLAISASPTQLTEGVAPDAAGITLNQFEATVEQYGSVVRISDLAELTAKHPVVQRTVYMLGLQAAEIYDQLIFNVLDAATNVYRPNNRAGDTSLLATDYVSYNDLIELMALMQDQGARALSGGDYAFVTPPQVHAALLKDPDFKAANQFARPDRIFRGEVENLGGFRIVRSNSPAFASTAQTTVGFANKVYSSFAIGANAYQITDLQNLQMYVVQPGGQTDPLQQSRKMGWKFAFKSIITNQNWIRRVRSAGLNSVAYV